MRETGFSKLKRMQLSLGVRVTYLEYNQYSILIGYPETFLRSHSEGPFISVSELLSSKVNNRESRSTSTMKIEVAV